jgi:hypothetical protein
MTTATRTTILQHCESLEERLAQLRDNGRDRVERARQAAMFVKAIRAEIMGDAVAAEAIAEALAD